MWLVLYIYNEDILVLVQYRIIVYMIVLTETIAFIISLQTCLFRDLDNFVCFCLFFHF